MKTIKTRTVTFSYGTVKDASLLIPAEAYSLMDAARLIRQSYLEYAFRPGCGLMSDEVLVSSIGHDNFFAGALGGYESRLEAGVFASLKECANNDIAMACDVVRFRATKQGREMTSAEVYFEASRNEALDANTRKMLVELGKIEAAKA